MIFIVPVNDEEFSTHQQENYEFSSKKYIAANTSKPVSKGIYQ